VPLAVTETVGIGSSSTIVAVAVDVAIARPTGLDSVTENVSLPS
jgi:hypothetical protein